MQFIFVDLWVTLEIILCGINPGTGISFLALKLSRLVVLFSSTNIFLKENPVF